MASNFNVEYKNRFRRNTKFEVIYIRVVSLPKTQNGYLKISNETKMDLLPLSQQSKHFGQHSS